MALRRWLGILAGLLVVAGVIGTSLYFLIAFSDKRQKTIEINQDVLDGIENIVPVAVIGSGPAGLSAALYTSRMSLPTVVFKGGEPGGQLMQTGYVENWPPVGVQKGPDIMKAFEKHVEHFGAQLNAETITKVDFTQYPFKLWTDEGREVNALSVIISTGSSPRKLGIEGEKEYWGRGVSSCAVCDAPFNKDKNVVVVGGGDSACEEALEIASVARKVTMLVRGDSMRASAIMKNRLRDYPNIDIKFNTKVKRILGDGKQLDRVELITNGELSEMPIDSFFLGIGHDPNTAIFKGQVTLTDQNYIAVSGRSQATSVKGVFSAGDVSDPKYKQAGVAAGDGIKAALDTVAFLREHGLSDQMINNLESQFYVVEDRTLVADLPMITDPTEYEEETQNETRPIVIDFFAPYCPSCMKMLPAFESVAARMQDQIKFIKSDVDVGKELADKFSINALPKLIVVKDGKIIAERSEALSKREMLQFLQKFVRNNANGNATDTK